MPGPVSDKRDQIKRFLERTKNDFHNLSIRMLLGRRNAIRFARHSLCKKRTNRPRMIININPIANIAPVAIQRQIFIYERLEHKKRNKFFRKLPWAKIIY